MFKYFELIFVFIYLIDFYCFKLIIIVVIHNRGIPLIFEFFVLAAILAQGPYLAVSCYTALRDRPRPPPIIKGPGGCYSSARVLRTWRDPVAREK